MITNKEVRVSKEQERSVAVPSTVSAALNACWNYLPDQSEECRIVLYRLVTSPEALAGLMLAELNREEAFSGEVLLALAENQFTGAQTLRLLCDHPDGQLRACAVRGLANSAEVGSMLTAELERKYPHKEVLIALAEHPATSVDQILVLLIRHQDYVLEAVAVRADLPLWATGWMLHAATHTANWQINEVLSIVGNSPSVPLDLLELVAQQYEENTQVGLIIRPIIDRRKGVPSPPVGDQPGPASITPKTDDSEKSGR